jgi:hypothetical protein
MALVLLVALVATLFLALSLQQVVVAVQLGYLAHLLLVVRAVAETAQPLALAT